MKWFRYGKYLTCSPLFIVTTLLSFYTSLARTAIQTSIFIDQVPLYAALPPCAEAPVSAIIRAQSSGCGDSQQLTSFKCFCLERSSLFSSIISTAVSSSCITTQTRAGRILPTAAPAIVTTALELFDSYCQRSTELPWYADNSTATHPPSVTITQPPQITTAPASTSTSPPSTSETRKAPVAAIVLPVVIAPLVAVASLFFILRHRRAARGRQPANQGITGEARELSGVGLAEMRGDTNARQEAHGVPALEKYPHELPAELGNRAELDASGLKGKDEKEFT